MRTEDGYIIQQCLDGDASAFAFLVEKYKKAVYSSAYFRVRNFHDAQDITQEVFVSAYRNLRSLKRWDNFVGWLYRITANHCKMLMRARAKRPDSEFVEDQEQDILDQPSIDFYHESTLYESIQNALDSLPETYRQVMTLRYFGGMTVKEMSRFLGVSPGTIDRRLREARAQLREGIPAMMSTAYKQNELPSTFTFRIVETVKSIRIHPVPRAAGLPWGLSLAAGIIIATLSMNPHLSLLNPRDFPRGTPLPVEVKVLKTGEIPVEILRISQTLAIASEQGEGHGGEVRPGDERGEFLLAPQASEVKLLPRDGAEKDYFGIDVSIHGDYAIVGASWKDEEKGAAYIFKRDGDSWKEKKMLSADDGRKEDRFGGKVAISDEFAFVSAYYDDDKGDATGSVYIFHRTGESWTQQAKLNPHGQWIIGCGFGFDIGISGDYLVVGSPVEEGLSGAIYIFKRDGNAWDEQAKLKSSNWNQPECFGYSVSISGDYAIAGAQLHDNGKGAAYIFKHEGETWKQQAILTADDGEEGDYFGMQCASISGDYAIVGAYTHKDKGAAYIFARDGTSWRQQAKLMPDDLMLDDDFGISAYISGDCAIVGSIGSGGKGAIYGFIREGDSWKQVSKKTANDGTAGDCFGRDVAFSGNYAIIGAPGVDVNGEGSGAAYIYNFADFFPVEPSGSSTTTFGGEKDRPALPDVAIPPPARQVIPREFRLLQNFPNPFNPDTWLPYELASDANVTIWIYNSSGELVRRLNPGTQEAGFYTTRDKAACWNGRNEAGEQVSSGTYFYTIQAGEFTATKKMAIAE